MKIHLTIRGGFLIERAHGWTRFSDLKKTTGLGAATLTRHLRALVADGSAERRVDTESGTHPPPTYYRLTPPSAARGVAASITIAGLKRVKTGISSLRPSGMYVDRRIPLDEITSREVSDMLRRAEDILAELQLTLILEERRSKLSAAPRRCRWLRGGQRAGGPRQCLLQP